MSTLSLVANSDGRAGPAQTDVGQRIKGLEGFQPPEMWHEILFTLFFARCGGNLTTALERQRLGRTMPGETAAIAGTRLGVLVG